MNILHFFVNISWQNTKSESKEICTYSFWDELIVKKWKMICSEIPKWFREWLFVGLAEYEVTFGEEAQSEASKESSIYFPFTHSFQLPAFCLNIHFADISEALKNMKVKRFGTKLKIGLDSIHIENHSPLEKLTNCIWLP